MTRRIHTAIMAALAAILIATPALAGPPLLCHPFDIGSARSLPWTQSWSQGQPDYRLDHLVGDTESLLTPSTPVLVRMETLRRAAIYASADQRVATELLSRLTARAKSSESAGHPEALAFLDAAYVAGAFREIGLLASTKEWAGRATAALSALGNADGYALISRSISLRPDDPAVQFAAALIASDKSRASYADHAAKARAGAAQDSLLARNLDHVQ